MTPEAARLPRVVNQYLCGHVWEPDFDTWQGMTPAGAIVNHILADCARCRAAKGTDKHKRIRPHDWGDLTWV